MKMFLIKLTIFAMLILMLNGIMFAFAYKLNYGSQYHNDEHPDQYSSFLFGSSDALSISHFPEELGIFNYGDAGGSYLNLKERLEYMIFNHSKIDTIYLSINDYPMSKHTNPYQKYSLILRKNYNNYFEYINDRYIKYYGAILNAKLMMGIALHYKQKVLVAQPKSPTTFTESDIARGLQLHDHSYRPSERSEKMAQALIDLLNICKTNDIAVVGIKYPFTGYLVGHTDKFGAEAIMKSYDVQILDYRQLFVDRTDYFGDFVHMNADGVQAFMKVFASDIQRLKNEGYIK